MFVFLLLVLFASFSECRHDGACAKFTGPSRAIVITWLVGLSGSTVLRESMKAQRSSRPAIENTASRKLVTATVTRHKRLAFMSTTAISTATNGGSSTGTHPRALRESIHSRPRL